MRILAAMVLNRRAESVFLAAALISLLLVVFSSIAILQFEAGAGNIRTAQEAIWWAIVTLTTVGNGDYSPVTREGRVVAAVVMIAGVCLLGTLTGLIASWFLGGDQSHNAATAELRNEIKLLREKVRAFLQNRIS